MPPEDHEAVFTIDVEDWYHGIELPLSEWGGKERRLPIGLEAVLGLLRAHRTRGTFFVLGWVAERHPELVKRIAEEGHEIGSHGYAHEKVYDQTPEQFRADIRRTKRLLESLSGRPVLSHRSPFFSVTESSAWALDLLKKEGYLYDCSISPVKTWRYGIRGSPEGPYRIKETGLIEFPLSSFRLLRKRVGIGGAYFRIFPYFLTEWGIDRVLSEGRPFVFYAHPWEYDPDHPVERRMDRRARWTHYFNLGSTLGKTARLLRRYRFRPLGEAVAALQARGAIPDVSLAALTG